MNALCILAGTDPQPGTMPPSGYLAWHEWASVQHKAGLRQTTCCVCVRWYFPQELHPQVHEFVAYDKYGNEVRSTGQKCWACAGGRP